MNRNLKKFDKALSKLNPSDIEYVIKSIQATEAGKDLVNLENLLFSFTVQDIAGTANLYKGYTAQVIETYLKYNGLRDYGCWQTKAIIDLRTSFICGTGLSVSVKNKKTAKWLEKFLNRNKLNGSLFIRSVKGTEFTGKLLYKLKRDNEYGFIKVIRIPYGNISTVDGDSLKTGINYKAELKDPYDINSINKIVSLEGDKKEDYLTKNFIYIITGGDDSALNETNTKVGMSLTEIENYDRILKEMRRSNYVVNRITPDFECKDANEATSTRNMISQQKWKIGSARIGTAKFSYKSASTSTLDNAEKELQANGKAIGSITSVPIHWIGHVEIMSNRATAQTLYEQIDYGTKQERKAIQEGLYDTIIKAMEIDIDSGKSTLNEIDYDIDVKLPLISFNQFKDNIAALSQAYADKAISINDYRNFIPGIDPIQTEKDIEKEEKKAKDDFKTPEEEINKTTSQLLKGDLNSDGDKNKGGLNGRQ